jgi:hypothetical protein
MPELDKVRLKRQNIRIRERKRVRVTLPGDLPVRTRPPAVAVDEEGEVAVVQEELAVHALDVDWLDVFFAGDEV